MYPDPLIERMKADIKNGSETALAVYLTTFIEAKAWLESSPRLTEPWLNDFLSEFSSLDEGIHERRFSEVRLSRVCLRHQMPRAITTSFVEGCIRTFFNFHTISDIVERGESKKQIDANPVSAMLAKTAFNYLSVANNTGFTKVQFDNTTPVRLKTFFQSFAEDSSHLRMTEEMQDLKGCKTRIAKRDTLAFGNEIPQVHQTFMHELKPNESHYTKNTTPSGCIDSQGWSMAHYMALGASRGGEEFAIELPYVPDSDGFTPLEIMKRAESENPKLQSIFEHREILYRKAFPSNGNARAKKGGL